MFGHFDEGVGQKLQSPPGTSLWRIGAGQRHQLRLLFATQLASRPRTGRFTEGGLQADLYKALLGAIDGRAAGLHRRGDGLVGDPGVGGQQDLHPLEPPHRQLPPAHQST